MHHHAFWGSTNTRKSRQSGYLCFYSLSSIPSPLSHGLIISNMKGITQVESFSIRLPRFHSPSIMISDKTDMAKEGQKKKDKETTKSHEI